MPSPKDKEKLLKKNHFFNLLNLMQDDLRFHLWRYCAQRLQDSKQFF